MLSKRCVKVSRDEASDIKNAKAWTQNEYSQLARFMQAH